MSRNYQTRAFLLAQHEADQAKLADLTAQLRAARRSIQSLGDRLSIAEAAVAARPEPVLLGRKALMAEAKRLAKSGTACYVRGDHIYAAGSRELIV